MQPEDLPEFRPILSTDLALYRKFFERDGRSTCYANSWTYISQACRGLGGGFRVHAPDALWSFGCDRERFVAVRPLGALGLRFVELVRRLHVRSGRPVVVKKLFPEQAELLREIGPFRAVADDPGGAVWDPACPGDDDTYPELIVDLDWLLPLARWRARGRQLRDFVRRATRFANSGRDSALSDYTPSQAEEVRAFLQQHFQPSRPEAPSAYECMLRSPLLANGRDGVWSAVARVEGARGAAGFFFAERLGPHTAGLYADVVTRAVPDFGEFARARFLTQLRDAGIRTLNVGGSETRGLHHYKHKLEPFEERPMRMLVFDES